MNRVSESHAQKLVEEPSVPLQAEASPSASEHECLLDAIEDDGKGKTRYIGG